MHTGRSAGRFTHAVLAMLMLSAAPGYSGAQSHDSHAAGAVSQPHEPTREEGVLVSAVRDATDRFKKVTSIDGPGEGFELMFGCVSGGDSGAMGLHYVNMGLVGDGDVKVGEPENILFEPRPGGGIRITGADYLVPVAAWDQKHSGEGPPMLMGQLFHFFDSPNRFGLDPFDTLHVRAWKENPNGAFVNWNPDVSCEAFNPPDTPGQ